MNTKIAFLILAKSFGLFALLRLATRRYPRILCYHGGNFGDERRFNPKLFCTCEQLSRRLEWLRRKGFVPVSLEQAAEANAVTAGIPIAVTIDDGWYSSYRDLLPLLAEFGHRPVLYLHTEAFQAGEPIVPVVVRYLLWKAGSCRVELHALAAGVDGEYNLADGDQRMQLCNVTERWISQQQPAEVAGCLERLSSQLGIAIEDLDLFSRRFSYMNSEELRRAVDNGCHIELHGHVHEYVIGQAIRNQDNIEQCRKVIQDAGLPYPVHYCYPSGAFDTQAPSVMRAAGVRTATTCLPGLVRPGHSDGRFFLPRFLDGEDVLMIEFEAEMSGVLELVRTLAFFSKKTNPRPPRIFSADSGPSISGSG